MEFRYRAKDPSGKTITGVVAAENETDAVGQLRRQGLTIIKISAGRAAVAATEGKAKGGFFSLSIGGSTNARNARVKSQDLVVFTRQLATMISAGIPVVEALEILGEQTSNAGFKAVISEIVTDLRTGKDLSQAFARHPRIFSGLYVNMLKAGEASGQLDTVLDRLAGYQEAAQQLKQDIKSAMTYPVVSLVLILGITVFLLVVIIPKFKTMFDAMNVELPALTKGLLELSRLVREHILLMFSGAACFATLVYMYTRTPTGRRNLHWLLLHLPVFGPLFSKVAISRFSRTFATLIQSGVPILGALELVKQTSGNAIIADAIHKASESVRQGENLGGPLAQTKVFPPMVTRMISVGERTGALEALLEKISEFYDREVKAAVESLTSLIEPLMIAIMGFLVGGMVLAIFMPIFKMIGKMSGH